MVSGDRKIKNMEDNSMYFNIDDVRNKLKENFSAFVDEYEAEVEASYRKKVLNLAPGQEAPEKGLDQQEAEAFDGRVSEYRHRAGRTFPVTPCFRRLPKRMIFTSRIILSRMH